MKSNNRQYLEPYYEIINGSCVFIHVRCPLWGGIKNILVDTLKELEDVFILRYKHAWTAKSRMVYDTGRAVCKWAGSCNATLVGGVYYVPSGVGNIRITLSFSDDKQRDDFLKSLHQNVKGAVVG
ncbi:MAG: hypothetical protein FWC79_05750 [Oscillospiraceae bacterium]|nr:hypothetical protein [Oscillospiraceae bacterium]